MKLTRLAGECPDGNTCPTLFATDRGTVIVQGRRATGESIGMLCLADDEYAVEVSVELLREAAGRC